MRPREHQINERCFFFLVEVSETVRAMAPLRRHTAVVVYGREWFFGGGGIFDLEPGQTPYGSPVQTIEYVITAPPALGPFFCAAVMPSSSSLALDWT